MKTETLFKNKSIVFALIQAVKWNSHLRMIYYMDIVE